MTLNQQPTVLERLRGRQQQYQSLLDEVNGCIAALEKNPDIEKILTSMSRVL